MFYLVYSPLYLHGEWVFQQNRQIKHCVQRGLFTFHMPRINAKSYTLDFKPKDGTTEVFLENLSSHWKTVLTTIVQIFNVPPATSN